MREEKQMNAAKKKNAAMVQKQKRKNEKRERERVIMKDEVKTSSLVQRCSSLRWMTRVG